jgi:BirA family biotin operon repressor/biotin-[acetyl-CoA-carboxylase] ligase
MKIGRKIIRLDSVDSTNNYTANLAKQGEIVSGTVILADVQTEGKGQRGTVWTSNASENLLLSVFIVPDNLSVRNQAAVMHFSALAMVKVLRKIGILAQVKWPNDIVVEDEKIAGILIENSIVGDKIDTVIIGIGCNVNQLEFGEIVATSVRKQLHESVGIMELVFQLIDAMNEGWTRLNKGDYARLKNDYTSGMFRLNEVAKFRDKDGEFFGKILGTDEIGRLEIEQVDREVGDIRSYSLKEIEFML